MLFSVQVGITLLAVLARSSNNNSLSFNILKLDFYLRLSFKLSFTADFKLMKYFKVNQNIGFASVPETENAYLNLSRYIYLVANQVSFNSVSCKWNLESNKRYTVRALMKLIKFCCDSNTAIPTVEHLELAFLCSLLVDCTAVIGPRLLSKFYLRLTAQPLSYFSEKVISHRVMGSSILGPIIPVQCDLYFDIYYL